LSGPEAGCPTKRGSHQAARQGDSRLAALASRGLRLNLGLGDNASVTDRRLSEQQLSPFCTSFKVVVDALEHEV